MTIVPHQQPNLRMTYSNDCMSKYIKKENPRTYSRINTNCYMQHMDNGEMSMRNTESMNEFALVS